LPEAIAATAKMAAAVEVMVRVDASLRFMMISFERGGNLRHGGPLNARRSSLVNRLGANRL
jgi:hypothetical protein